MSSYAAEFINVLTNVAYVILTAHGYRQSGWRMSVPTPFTVLFIVGLSSGALHAALKYRLQLTDDLSLLAGAATLLQRLCTMISWDKERIQFNAGFVADFVAGHSTALPVKGCKFYIKSVFGSLIVTVCFKSLYHVEIAEVSPEIR
jgi:Ceramidase